MQVQQESRETHWANTWSVNQDLILVPSSSQGTPVEHIEVSSIFSTKQAGWTRRSTTDWQKQKVLSTCCMNKSGTAKNPKKGTKISVDQPVVWSHEYCVQLLECFYINTAPAISSTSTRTALLATLDSFGVRRSSV